MLAVSPRALLLLLMSPLLVSAELPIESRPWPNSDAEFFRMTSDDGRRQTLLKRALGTWRCEKEDGTVIEKVIEPAVETVTLTRDGEVVRVWKTKWDIRVCNGIALFWFKDYRLVEGERSAPDGLGGGYALAITGDTWTEVPGLVGEAPSPPTLVHFKKVSPEEAEKAVDPE